MSVLEVDDLSVSYAGRQVLDGARFHVDAGEAVGLVGASGAGKSQAALAILGLLPADAEISGRIRVAGEDVLGASPGVLKRLRAQRVGIVFQDPMQALNPHLRVGRQLAEVLRAHGLAGRREAAARAVAALERVGLPDPGRQARAYPHELSGGMRQRAMIAAALIAAPDLLIADEPTTALDVTVQAQLLELLESLREDTALLLITHDLGIIAGHSDRTVVLEAGRVVETAMTPALFAAPESDAARRLLAAAPRLQVKHGAGKTGKTLLCIEAARVEFGVPSGQRLTAVAGVDLALLAGETLAIVGESGSGKSSLARALLGLLPLSAGRVIYAGRELAAELDRRPLSVRRDLQLVFQDPVGALNPQLTVAAIVAEPLGVHRPEVDADAAVHKALEQVGLAADYAGKHPHQLSGGEAQRVAIARALIAAPAVLVLDEAVASLDGVAREQVLELLASEQARTGLSVAFISHDLGVVSAISHRVAVLYLGRVLELAPAAAVFMAPQHPYTRALIDAVPVPDPAIAERPTALRGEIPSPLTPPGGCVFHPRCAHAIDACRQSAPMLRTVGDSEVACHRAGEI